MRDPELVLEVMETRKDRNTYSPGIDDPAFQIEATLILAHQVKRIADLLDEWSIGDEGNRTLFVASEDST